MKLAEYLQQRADLNQKIAELRTRICNNAVVQDGEKPAEDPKELIAQLDSCIGQLETLIQKINLVNCQTIVEGKTLTEWIAVKDCLTLKLDCYRDMVSRASNLTNRMTRSEIKVLSAIDVRKVQKKVDEMSASLRKVDNLIQSTNWSTEV